MNVSNKKCIRRLGLKNMKATKCRNIIAVIAIALTTLLFTALFTIIGSISYGFEQSNFRQVGTYSHGEFKRLELEQYEMLKNDTAIKEYGIRRIAGIAVGEEFTKHYTEVSYCSENTAEWMYLSPTTGRLPKENTNEFATDRKVLALINAKGEVGEEITLAVDVDGVEVFETFTLCGIWDYDGASPASHILISESKVEELISANTSSERNEIFGTYFLDVMLKSDNDINGTMNEILQRNGFQNTEVSSDNYIAIGVNWGYISENLDMTMDSSSIMSLVVLIAIIVTVGYLIIFNVFRISVTNDIRSYGLLKTIGTTGKQIRHIVLVQALVLSATGIPIGLVLGWIVGVILTPVVMNELNVYNAGASANPIIFIFSAIFALITVIISCLRPAKIASKVSPVEAVRYTESNGKATVRKSSNGVSIFGMAIASLGRSKGKTTLTVISLSLSVVLFSVSYSFAGSFSMEKYLSDVTNDFVVSCPEYFSSGTMWEPENAITEYDIDAITSIEGIETAFTAYGTSFENMPEVLYTEQQLYNNYSRFMAIDESAFNDLKADLEKGGEHYISTAQLLGMEKSGFSKIEVIEGELNILNEDGYIAVVDQGNFSVGDKVTFVFTDSITYINNVTNEETANFDDFEENEWKDISFKRETHEKEYTVCAIVDSDILGYGYSTTSDMFIMESENFVNTVKSAAPLYTAIDVVEEYEASVETFIDSYTDNEVLDYSSRAKTEKEFQSFRRMFLILGSSLSGIVCLIGLLNFLNTVITGIFARKRELSILRSIGMTGKQLKKMLIYEGMFYTILAITLGVVTSLITIPFSSFIESIFWFCDYKFSIVPFMIMLPLFLVVGIVIPLITYKIFNKKTVVERLREIE